MSSANINKELETRDGNSFMYKVNNKGPNTDPCGTPLSTHAQEDK